MSYDDERGIVAHLDTLQAFNLLLEDRNRAGYERHEHLQEWVVLGRWLLDGAGNCLTLRFENERYEPVELKCLPACISSEEFWAKKLCANWVATYGCHIPHSTSTCMECHCSWHIDNAHDCHATYNHSNKTWEFRHPICERSARRRVVLSSFQSAFVEAGFPAGLPFEEVPNPYYSAITNPGWTPAFRFMTAVGPIDVWWRKRVIEMSAAASGVDFSQLFRNECVTVGNDYVHAWNYERLAAYLQAVLLAAKER